MLTEQGAESRRRRLLAVLEQNRWDLFFTADPRTIYYLTAKWCEGPAAMWLTDEGEMEVVVAETYSIKRVIDYPELDLAEQCRPFLEECAGHVMGMERRSMPAVLSALAPWSTVVEDATDAILGLRKRKDADEIAEIRESLGLCAEAYRAAKAVIAPGLREVDVYAAMYAAVVKKQGTAVTFQGDFACGERSIKGGGPPTERVILPGDLYVLDLFPSPHYYFGDTCRTFAAGEPVAVQREGHRLVLEAMTIAEEMIRPGVRAKDVYAKVKGFLDSHAVTENSFRHHVGHGIGHRGHEAPRIIPGSEDVFEIGDVFTLEPGVYCAAMQGGIRVEDNYVVTAAGIENLFTFPRDL